jgi:DNA-binding NtrC family response regulator
MSDPTQASAFMPYLSAANLDVYSVKTCREARAFLSDRPTVDLIITELSLPDGNWCDMVQYMVDHTERTTMVVTCPEADEQLWSEVLWRGVFDLLVEPYDRQLVKRVVEGALRWPHLTSRLSPRSAKHESSAGGRSTERPLAKAAAVD